MRLGVALKIRQRPDVLQSNHSIQFTVLSMLHQNLDQGKEPVQKY
jgi:hypothetical protein